ncbi:hypothetical protein [Frigoribacterium sp. PhB24]|uniref:hypothetical protein n=1 Tax=Frigoribacterium sp. PhB24 TaxID=2485204 RepID=UPI000F49CC51|nr:hypothetical protein [Frigoribacterium sp. PhB24]ROS54749.1 hypothetical protein EDF50_0842 [Frigoribacterium sp. PhB24]
MDPASRGQRDPEHRGRRTPSTLLAVVGAAAFVLGGALTVQAGTARALEPVPETGLDGHLVLADDLTGTADIAPSSPGRWQIATDVTTGDRVALSIELVSSGSLVERRDGLTLGVEACDVEWQRLETTPRCATGQRTVTEPTRASSFVDGGPAWPVRSAGGAGRVFLLVSLGLVDGPASDDGSLMGLTARVGVGITATALDPIPTLPAEPGPNPDPDPTDEPQPGGSSTAVPGADPEDGGAAALGDGADGTEVVTAGADVAVVRADPRRALAYTGGLAVGPAVAGAGALLVGLALHLRGRRRTVTP